MESRNIMLVLLIFMAPVFVACQYDYTTQHFSFPPGTKPHENDWDYTALVAVSSSTIPITSRSQKSVKIEIYNRSKAILLKDDFKFMSASIEARAVWEKFDEIQIELVEVGNRYAEDRYNQELLKSGPNRLLNVTYEYDQVSKKFTQKGSGLPSPIEDKDRIPHRRSHAGESGILTAPPSTTAARP